MKILLVEHGDLVLLVLKYLRGVRLEMTYALLALLVRNLGDAMSVATVKNTHRLLGNGVSMILERAVRRPVRAILFPAENFSFLLLDDWGAVVELALLTLLHRGQNVLLLLDLLDLLGRLPLRVVQS